jgi:hypothetical protein
VTGSGLSRLQPGNHSKGSNIALRSRLGALGACTSCVEDLVVDSGSMHGPMSRSSYVAISLRSSHTPCVRTAPTRDTSNCGELDKLHIPCTQDEGPAPGRAFVLLHRSRGRYRTNLTIRGRSCAVFWLFCVVHSSALLGIHSYNTSQHKRAQHHAAMIWCYLRGICWFRLLQGGLWGNR